VEQDQTKIKNGPKAMILQYVNMPANQSANYLKELIPPLFLTLRRKGKRYGWKGDYKNWQQAKNRSGNYDDHLILEKVKQASMKVIKGEAVYERDSVLFDQIQYSWPLLATLLWIAAKKKGVLKVADFGGSLGSSYFQNRSFLSIISQLQWNIIEQRSFVECGQKDFQNDVLHFFYNSDQMIAQQGLPDLLILSCVLPYLENPYEILENLIQYKIPHIIIDNTYFNYENRDRICIQRIPPEIYNASYPCWFLNYEHVQNTLANTYEMISTHQNDSFIFLDGKKIQYRGLLFKIKE
jgi:putative methyltransferase (TIGR04325 family)